MTPFTLTWPDLFRSLALGGAGFCLWLLLLNRKLLLLVDGPRKTLVIALALVVLVLLPALGSLVGSVSSLSTLRPAPPGSSPFPSTLLHLASWWWLPVLAVLLGVVAGEGRRALLRHRHRAAPPVESLLIAPPRLAGLVTTTSLVLHRYREPTDLLPSGRLRIAQLSDLHVSDQLPPEHYLQAFEAAQAEQPDLLLLTGDFVSRAEHLPLLEQVLAGHTRARLGTYAVLGNHDHWSDPGGVREILTRHGVTLLAGRCEQVALPEGGKVRVCGTEHPWGPGLAPPAEPPDPQTLTLVLSHTPDNIYDLARPGHHAIFGGHYHAGQIRLPLLDSLVVPSRFGRRFDVGHFQVQGVHLFVSSGVGAYAPPLRLGCPPDVVIVDFVAQPRQSPPPQT